MDSILSGLIGQVVQIFSVRGETETSDTGTLKACDGAWLCLDRGGDLLYFSVSLVRLVKPL